MEIIIAKPMDKEKEITHKMNVLTNLEANVKELIESHAKKQKLWFSSDFLPADEKINDGKDEIITRLRDRARGIKDSIRAALVVNIITEEGLPHFHRLLSNYLGEDNFWAKWINLWTAEEDRHGNILRDYVRDSRIFNFRKIEQIQFDYQNAGFNPDWKRDPYRVFVYTTLQEKATQISHKNTGKHVRDDEPLLNEILSNIAADEAKHFNFYRNIFKEILRIDPEGALQSAVQMLPSIDMPGNSMPHFREIAEIIRRTGIYGPWDYKAIVDDIIQYWRIEFMTGLNDIASKAQEKIMSIPKRLKSVAEYIEQKTTSKTFSFDFIYNRLLEF